LNNEQALYVAACSMMQSGFHPKSDQANQQIKKKAQYYHRCDRKIETEIFLLNANVAWEPSHPMKVFSKTKVK